MAKIQVTGTNGYIGSLLVNTLKSFNHQVENASYRLPNIPTKSIEADIIIHLAVSGGGTVHKPRTGADDPEVMKNVNVKGMEALLSGVKNPKTKILFMSSTSVYGKFADSPLVTEEAKLVPISIYGEHKVESELVLKNSDFDWLILRPCGIFGPSSGNRFGNSFLNIVTANAINKGEITILGGEQKIDTLYLLDLIHVILRICNDEWHSRETFNVAGEIITVEEMINSLVHTIQNIGFRVDVSKKDFQGKPAVLADTNKLRQAFPKWNTTPLNCSMHALVSAYLNQ